ncbi:MAG: SGNH/GDSL hydrolase family protein [Patulibacter sp.]
MARSHDDERRSPWRGPRQLAALVVIAVALVAFVIVGLTPSKAPEPAPTTAIATTPTQPSGLVYLALGDSLSRGVQPDDSVTLKHGYPRQLERSLRSDLGVPVTLIEAGCGGATTQSFIDAGKTCQPDAPVPYANDGTGTSQFAYAIGELRARRELPTLVTLSLGGNDLTPCAKPDRTQMQDCLDATLPQVKQRWKQIATTLREAAGPRTVFSVLTTYDPFLGLTKVAPSSDLDRAVVQFHTAIVKRYNPALRRIFAGAGWKIADLGREMHETARTTRGSSRALRAVCDLTWACSKADIHLNDEGYAVAASLIEAVTLDALHNNVAGSSGG